MNIDEFSNSEEALRERGARLTGILRQTIPTMETVVSDSSFIRKW